MTIKEELELICSANNGIIRPEDVVSYGRENPDSMIAQKIVWDDEAAGERFRLLQAETMIRTYYVRIEVDAQRSVAVRQYVSLRPDRVSGIGYRSIQSVLKDEEFHTQMINEALRELKAFRRKYASLNELSKVHSTIDEFLMPDSVVAEG